jgi:nucleotide-binding universal stress UspA family protein
MNTTQLSERIDHQRGGTLGLGLPDPKVSHVDESGFGRKSRTELQKPSAREPKLQILVAVDFTPASIAALEHACVWAKQLQASVLLFHVLNPIFSGRFVNLVTKQKVHAEARRRALARINALADFHANEGLMVTCAVQDGLPEIEILRVAEKMNVNMIVLGRRQRNLLGRWLWGSVSADIVDLAHCPVVLVNHSTSSQQSFNPLRSALWSCDQSKRLQRKDSDSLPQSFRAN